MTIFASLFPLIGIINAIFIPLALYYVWNENGRFPIRSLPFSHAGDTHTARIFSKLVAIAATLELLFLVELFTTLPALQTPLLIALPLIGMAALLLTAAVSSKRSFIIHRICTGIMVWSLIAWSFLFHTALLAISTLIGSAGLFLSTILVLGIPVLYFRHKSFGSSEVLFASVVVVWNLLMTYLILVQ